MSYAQVNGGELYYEEHGHGRPLLLMAPTGWPAEVWQLEQVDALSRECRVIVYDYRGVGRSTRADVELSTQVLADDALALLRAAGAEPADVLGFSVGGRAAQLMALQRPGSLRRLILAGSDAGHPTSRPSIPADLALAIVDPGYDHPDFWLDHLTQELPFSPAFRRDHPDKVRTLAATIRAQQPPLKLYLRHVIARMSHYSGDRLADIRVPTLVLAGAQDSAGGSADHVQAARQLASAIPGAQLELIPSARHLFPWEAPAATNQAILRFLR